MALLLSYLVRLAQPENEGELSSSWNLHGVPYVEFYCQLHEFLKKVGENLFLYQEVGSNYISINRQLQERGSSPSNTYKFIEPIVSKLVCVA